LGAATTIVNAKVFDGTKPRDWTSGDPLTDITATRAIERIWREGIACDRHAFVASAAEAEQLDAFDAQLAKVVAAVRERWSN
jgi:hypothetical protein